MEIFEHDKNRKAYYVFPWGTRMKDAAEEVATTKHINPNKLEFTPGYVIGDELFLGDKRKIFQIRNNAKRVLVIYKRTKIDRER